MIQYILIYFTLGGNFKISKQILPSLSTFGWYIGVLN